MTEDFDINDIESVPDYPAETWLPAVPERPARPRRPARFVSLALIPLVAVIVLAPGLRKRLRPQLAAGAGSALTARPSGTDTLPAVLALWKKLDLDELPAEAVRDLRQGKYFYDNRMPGNFGLAIDYWEKAVARSGGTGRDDLQRLIASARQELARWFSADSSNAFVLLKQGKRDQALALLERMRADYLDITTPQYVWASQTLARRRR